MDLLKASVEEEFTQNLCMVAETCKKMLTERDKFNLEMQRATMLGLLIQYWERESEIPYLKECRRAAELQKATNYF